MDGSQHPLITLTTDFGFGSSYVAQLKGVLLSALPYVRLVDVAHDLPPQSIRHAETLLRSTAFAFPKGSVNLVVVDPGVGTSRRPIAVQSRERYFVGPDNGVLGIALAWSQARAVVLDRHELFRQPVSATFHGRDIFAPVAAALAGGASFEEVGSAIHDALPSTLPSPTVALREVRGETLAADSFGNLLTNIWWRDVPEDWFVFINAMETERVGTYGEAQPQRLLALQGSDGYLEIAVRDGSAAQYVGADVGLQVVCRPE